MRIVLISPSGGITNLGLRYLSAVLKEKKHQVKLIFLPRRFGKRGDFDDLYSPYSSSVMADLKKLCQEIDLIGISVMTPYFTKAVELTRFLKKEINKPIVWGGIHPTVEPEECLQFADAVCLGEGEEAILELAEKLESNRDYTKTANFWFNQNGKIIKNPLRPLKQNLDTLPFPDYDLENHYLLVGSRVVRLNKKRLAHYLPSITGLDNKTQTAYSIFCTRGCPHSCSYCCNNALRRLYPEQNYIRRRSIPHIIKELASIKNGFPFIKGIRIEDDSFLVAPAVEIANFAREYRKFIGLPFICLSSPVNITEEKIKCLLEAGLIGIQMGIQSGSDTLNKNIFNRPIPAEKILTSAKIINKYQDKMISPRYDLITDNPFEKEKDLIATVKLLSKIPGKYILNLYSLVYYPGTALYQKATGQGLIIDKTKTYLKDWLIINMTYLKFLIFINRFSFFKTPQGWLRFLLAKPMIKTGEKFNFLFAGLYRLIYFIRLRILA